MAIRGPDGRNGKNILLERKNRKLSRDMSDKKHYNSKDMDIFNGFGDIWLVIECPLCELNIFYCNNVSNLPE